jgi:hypothetical protein
LINESILQQIGGVGVSFSFGPDNLLLVQKIDPGGPAHASGKVCSVQIPPAINQHLTFFAHPDNYWRYFDLCKWQGCSNVTLR